MTTGQRILNRAADLARKTLDASNDPLARELAEMVLHLVQHQDRPMQIDAKTGRISPVGEEISLRDHFAAHALAGMCGGGWRPTTDESRETLARDAYKAADAMLKVKDGNP